MQNDVLPGLLFTGLLLLSPPGRAQQGGEAPRPAAREEAPAREPGLQEQPRAPATWAAWWEFHGDAFLHVKDAVHTPGPSTGEDRPWGMQSRRAVVDSMKPTREQIQNGILPVLKQAIDDATERDVDLVTASLIALARIGQDHADFRLCDVFAKHLVSRSEAIRETAALSLGIAAMAGERQIDLLVGLALDDPSGRKACAAPAVDERTRAFASYGLGLLAARSADVAGKTRILRALKQILADEHVASPELRVAAVSALGMLGLDDPAEPVQALRTEALAVLEHGLRQPPGTGEPLSQAYCATSIARLLGRGHAQAASYEALFAERLAAKGANGPAGHDLARACALALGQVCSPQAAGQDGDAKYGRLLLDQSHDHADEQVRAFALLALGQIGGAENRQALLAEFGKANDPDRKAWCALSLGVLAFSAREAQQRARQPDEPDLAIGAALLAALQDHPDRRLSPALAIGLGLCRYLDAADPMRTLLFADGTDEELAGDLCTGLALLGDRRSIETLQEVFAAASRRLGLLQHSAIALAVLGDKSIEDKLSVLVMQEGLPPATLAAAAATLARVGDERTVSLRTMLKDPQRSPQARAFAAMVLGGIADKEQLPWHTKLGANIDYRAAVPTLTNGATGVLDRR